jgi:hypothetical protein
MGFDEFSVFEILQPFRRAHIAIKQLPAYNRTMFRFKLVNKLIDKTVGFFFRLIIGSLDFAVFESYCHHRAGDDATGLTHAGHASAKGAGHFERQLPVKPKFLTKRGQYSLRSAKGLFETFDSLCRLIHYRFLIWPAR